jgi:DNA-binding response OmpR family regulator
MHNDKNISSKESARTSTAIQTNPPRRILVVDDDDEVRHTKVAMLINYGYDVEDAVDGADGWKALQESQFNLVITDNSMPKMTGVEMIEKLRSSGMTIPVIMATGHMPTLEFIRKPWLRPDIRLIAPFSDDELVAAIRSVLHKDDDDDDDDDIPPESLLPKYL